MNRLNLLFLSLLSVFLLSKYAGENLGVENSVMQRVRSVTDECLKSMTKIKQGELILRFHTMNEEQPSFSVQKTLDIVFDDKKMMVIHHTEGQVVYAFNCYKPGTLAYFRTSPSNIVGSPPLANLDIQDFHLDHIENNTFKLFDYPILFARSVRDLTFTNNKLTRTTTYDPFAVNKATFWLDGCRNVLINAN